MFDQILLNRSLIEIKGDNRKNFLQGLVTNDVNKVNSNELLYSFMLNAQGRFLYDFFLFEKNNSLFIDCSSERCEEIVKKLNFYKLRSAIEITKNDSFFVIQNFSKKFNENNENIEIFNFLDPRSKNLGFRSYVPKFLFDNQAFQNSDLNYNQDSSFYHFQRIVNKIPESEEDLTYEKSFILEFGFDDLSAISYEKGCYIGQELTARTHHLGELRKKVFYAKTSGAKNSQNKISKNTPILINDSEVGIVLSSVFFAEEWHFLVLLRIHDYQKLKDSGALMTENHDKITQEILIIS